METSAYISHHQQLMISVLDMFEGMVQLAKDYNTKGDHIAVLEVVNAMVDRSATANNILVAYLLEKDENTPTTMSQVMVSIRDATDKMNALIERSNKECSKILADSVLSTLTKAE